MAVKLTTMKCASVAICLLCWLIQCGNPELSETWVKSAFENAGSNDSLNVSLAPVLKEMGRTRGRKFPNYRFIEIRTNDTMHLYNVSTGPILVMFFTKRCFGCKQVIDSLDSILPEFAKGGMRTILLSIEAPMVLAEFADQIGPNWTVGSINPDQIYRPFQAQIVPSLFLFDHKRIIRFVWPSDTYSTLPYAELRKQLSRIIPQFKNW